MGIRRIGLCPMAAILCVSLAGASPAAKLTPIEELGKRLFFDKNLSTPTGQSCAACHDPRDGWTGPLENLGGVYEGALKGRFGNRKPPSAAYAGDSPILSLDKEGKFIGGMFWDGRATGSKLKDPLAEQAGGPFLNPLEQNNPDKKAVVAKVKKSEYASLFGQAWKINPDDWNNTDKIYELISRSIAAFERSPEVNPFDAKFDLFWKNALAKNLKVEAIDESNWKNFLGLGLGESETSGLMLFNTKGKCALCHVLVAGPNGRPPVFTDYTYDNLGLPRNPENPFYTMGIDFNPKGKDWVDHGLGGYLESVPQYAKYAAENIGKHKVPTLRNVDLRESPSFVKVYGHNGALRSLKEVVHFYNTRDNGKFPPPEVKANLNTEELGNLGLTEEEENAVVAFLRTLSDHFVPKPK
jgi:cytochrome c peroxidase